MAGHRTPGSWGIDLISSSIDDGTMCRAETPDPGTLRFDARSNRAAQATGPADDLSAAIARFRASNSWRSLQPIVFAVIGPESFGLGVIYGMGENVVSGIVDLADIARTFLLADLYDRSHRSTSTLQLGPVALFQQIVAEVGMRAFGSTLEQAHKDRQILIDELTYAVKHPAEVFDHVAADYGRKWREFEALSGQALLSSQFNAGRIFGEVLVDVLAVIGTGAAAVKAASRIPRLARLARTRRVAAVAEVAAPASAGPYTTPSRLHSAGPVVASGRAAETAPATISADAATNMPKGKRPSPETYTAPDAIQAHRALFKAGAAKVVPHAPQGAVGPPQGTFVLPKTYVDQAIKNSGGDVRKLEQLLGLEKGYLGENPVLVEVARPSGLRMPSGNEPGANPQWTAGGFTSGGVPEAVVDQIQLGTYTVRPVFPK